MKNSECFLSPPAERHQCGGVLNDLGIEYKSSALFLSRALLLYGPAYHLNF